MSEAMSLTSPEEVQELERWHSFQAEMEQHEKRLAQLAKNFLDLNAYEEAAKCAIKAEGLRYVLGRMPK